MLPCNNMASFYEELFDCVSEFHKGRQEHGTLYLPTHILKEFWNKIKAYAKKGNKNAEKIHRLGYTRFKSVIKWLATDHHIWELVKIKKGLGNAEIGKLAFKHALKHHKV